MGDKYFVEVRCEDGTGFRLGPLRDEAQAKRILAEERARYCGKDCLIRMYTDGKW